MKRFPGFTVLCALAACGALRDHQRFCRCLEFAVMGDTSGPAQLIRRGQNPNGVPVSIINQINRRLIEHGVKFVVQGAT